MFEMFVDDLEYGFKYFGGEFFCVGVILWIVIVID